MLTLEDGASPENFPVRTPTGIVVVLLLLSEDQTRYHWTTEVGLLSVVSEEPK